MADRYWQPLPGSPTVISGNFSDTQHWAASDGGAVGASAPTASDNAIFPASLTGSYTITFDVNSACAALDFSLAGGTPTLAGGAVNLSLNGDLKLKSGMGFTFSGGININTNVAHNFTTSGVSLTCSCTLNAGSVVQQDAFSQTLSSVIATTTTWDQNGFTLSITGALTTNLGGTLKCTGATTNNGNWGMSGTYNGVGATLNVGTIGTGANFQSATAGSTYATVTWKTNAIFRVMSGGQSGAVTFVNLTIQGTAGTKTCGVSVGHDFSVSGSLTLQGTAEDERLWLAAGTNTSGGIYLSGSQRTITVSSAPTLTHCTFGGIVASGSTPWAGATRVGDTGNNSGITFTAPANVTAAPAGTASFNWNDSTKWSNGLVPLPQDAITVSNAFIAGRTITANIPILGKDITFTCTGSPGINLSVPVSVFGSLSYAAGMAVAGGGTMTLRGRGSHLLTYNGAAGGNSNLAIDCYPGSYTLQDAQAGIGGLSVNSGTWDWNGMSSTAISFASLTTTSNGRTIRSSGGTVTISQSGGVGWQVASAGLTLDLRGCTVKLISTSAVSATQFSGAGMPQYGTLWLAGTTTVGYQMLGSNTFQTIAVDPGKTLAFTAGTTTTATTWNMSGAIIGSITAATHTLAKAGGGYVSCSGMSISQSIATPASTFFAGSLAGSPSSADGGNNSGWIFADVVLTNTIGTSSAAASCAAIAQAVWNSVGSCAAAATASAALQKVWNSAGSCAASATASAVAQAVWNTAGHAAGSATGLGITEYFDVFTRLVTLDEAKLHLRIDDDDHDDDIIEKLLGASSMITDYLKLGGALPSTWIDETGSITVPADIKAATLLALAELYREREAQYADPLSKGVRDLLIRHRDPSLA